MVILLAALLSWSAQASGAEEPAARVFDPSTVIDPAGTKGAVADVATLPEAPAASDGEGTGGEVDGGGGGVDGGPEGDGGGEQSGTEEAGDGQAGAEGSGGAAGDGTPPRERILERRTGVEDITPFTPGYGAAAQLPAPRKQAEAGRSCKWSPFPVSAMMGVPGQLQTEDEDGSLPLLALAVCAAALAFAGAAFAVRRVRGRGRTDSPPKGTLETVATLVAIVAAVAGLAAEFAGVGTKERPAREAILTVRDVDARITRGEYAEKLEPRELRHIGPLDRREIGNVVWLELVLRGFEGAEGLRLQQASFDPDRGTLLSVLDEPMRIAPPRTDGDTRFIPFWVGYPASRRFVAEFRLVEGQAVRQLAGTGKMRSSRFRYACKDAS
jgi:hypothetical protein